MSQLANLEPIEYLVIGHITNDITQEGPQLGGTASYAALTANRIGLKVGVVTSWGCEIPLGPLEDIPIINNPVHKSTIFENKSTESGRIQFLYNYADPICGSSIPDNWKKATIVHIGPVLDEINPEITNLFQGSLICSTLQGFLRKWNEHGVITQRDHLNSIQILESSQIAIISIEDVQWNENIIQELAGKCPIFVVTEGCNGSRVYWYGDVRHFNAPNAIEIDSTGAGDIFAAAFFIQYHKTKNPWEAARFANRLASNSISRFALNGVPTSEEVLNALSEVI